MTEGGDRKLGVAEPGSWLCCWPAATMQEPTTAWSAAGSGGGGRNVPSAKVNLELCGGGWFYRLLLLVCFLSCLFLTCNRFGKRLYSL